MECTKCRREIVDGAAFCPYCGEKVAEEAKPLYTAEVKGLLKSGTLAVYADRVEFITSNVQRMVIVYSTLVSVKKGLDRIVFMTEDGRSESCTVNRKNIHEAFLYIDKASQPYIAARQERLLAQGVRYSLVSSMGLTGGGVQRQGGTERDHLLPGGPVGGRRHERAGTDAAGREDKGLLFGQGGPGGGGRFCAGGAGPLSGGAEGGPAGSGDLLFLSGQ